jgi:acyl-homoserine-lactone acylase
MGFLADETNRSLRIQELLAPYEADNIKMTYDDLKKIKYDQRYASSTFYTNTLSNLDAMMGLDPQKYPDIADVLQLVKTWNKQTTTDNKTATIFAVAITYVLEYVGKEVLMSQTNVIPMEVYVDALRKAKAYMLKHFGSISVPLGRVQLLVRGDREIPIGGMPENLAPSFIEPYKDGKFKYVAGESYIQIARYNKEGLVTLETVQPYGASNQPNSPHYSDQMDLFANQKLKPMTLDKKTIFANATAIYHPEPADKK